MRALEQEISIDQFPKARILLGLWIFSVVTLILIYLGSDKDGSVSISNLTHRFYHPRNPSSPSPSPLPSSSYEDELEDALSKVSTENRTVIISVVNKEYTEGDKSMLDIFLDGFWVGDDTYKLTKHLLIVAVDQTSYDRCTFLELHCYKLKTEGVEFNGGEKLFTSDDFIKLILRRTLFLRDVLKHGYSFIFTDMDVLWLRDPFPWLKDESLDLQISVDRFNGDEWSEDNPINTGFYMIRSNNRTISLYDEWYREKDNSEGKKKDQDVLFDLMREGAFERLGLRVRFLDTIIFSGFCENSKDVKKVSTVHANCCRSIKAKETDLLKVIHDWKRFKAYYNFDDDESEFQWSDHRACRHSWIRH